MIKELKWSLLFVITNIVLLGGLDGYAQIKKENLKWGISYGMGAQDRFPFDLPDYKHEVSFYKVVLNYRFKNNTKWTFEVNLEPSFNVAKHQLLNKYYVKPSDADDYREQNEFYMQERTIKEYVLNCGLIARYKIYDGLSTYAIGSVGPMISNKETERLAKGFAFSDILGLGLSFEINKIQLDFRYSLRHTSNLEMKQPNGGHNTTNTEFSVLFKL